MLSFMRSEAIAQLKKEIDDGRNPRDAKVFLAQEIVTRFHSAKDAEKALEDFETRFQKGDLPDNMLEISISSGPIAQVLKGVGLTQSTSDAFRMIDGGGVKLNGERVSDKKSVLTPGQTVVLQVGKRKFAKVTLV